MTIEYVKNSVDEFVCQHKNCAFKTLNQNTMCYHMKRHMKDFKFNCKECDMGFIQKSAFLHHMAAKHPNTKEVSLDDKEKIVNPYNNKVFGCVCCDHKARTKANALVHYARLHSDGWIPAYNKEKPECPHCNKNIDSVASYLYHCTGCIPASKLHRDNISRIIESV